MNANTSIKVSTRLVLGFGTTTILGLGIAGYGAMAMHTLSDKVTELATDRMVKVSRFTNVLDNFNAISRAAQNIIITDDMEVRDVERKKIVDLRMENTEILSKLDPIIKIPASRDLLKILNDNRGPYNAAMDRAIDSAVKGDRAGASALLLGEVRLLQNVVFKAASDSRDLQQQIAVTLAADGAAIAKSGTLLLVGLALLMGVIGTAVGLLLSRSLRRALGAEPAELARAAGRVADGDLSLPLTVRPGDNSSVIAAMARMQQALNDVVGSVRASSENVATASAQIAQGNEDLSQRTEEQASALQETAATMDELGTTVRNTADNAQQANRLARNASEIATRGGEVVSQVVDTMKVINDSSRKVADIIGVIDSIAFQTNILALNAAVEAARAGEQGRGFAVVASEVRNLAQRSAEAAKEIKILIGNSVEQVGQGTALVDRAGQTMTEIVDAIRRVSEIAGEISSATAQQSTGVGQVGEAVTQMDQVTQQNAALVEESAAAAASLKGQAQELVQAVAVFRLARVDAVSLSVHGGVAPMRVSEFERLNLQKEKVTTSRSGIKRTLAVADRDSASSKVKGETPNWHTF